MVNLTPGKLKAAFVICLLSPTFMAQAQTPSDTGLPPSVFIWIFVGLFLLLLFGISFLAGRLINTSAKNMGVDREYSILPKWNELIGNSNSASSEGKSITKIKKGYDIKLLGKGGNNS